MFPGTLRREILILLTVKGLLLAVLYFTFFSPAHRVETSPRHVEAHILGE